MRYLLILCLIVLVSGCTQDQVFCTQDAMQCPDGSYVSRIPPDCEFEACPGCSGNQTINGTCPDGTPYLKYSCGDDGEWHEVMYVRDPCGEITKELEENCVGFLVGDPNEAMTVNLIGGTIVRPHPGPFSWESIEPSRGSFDFGEPDSWIRKIQEHDVSILATLWPFAGWDQETCHSGECDVPEGIFSLPSDDMKDDKPEEMEDDKTPPSSVSEWRCAPCDYDDYRSFLKVLVERYDGDGNDDMPGLEIPIRYWEISNEPDMQDGTLTFFLGSPQDYVDILEASYGAIKEACPDCMVVQGGAAGTDDNMMAFWDSVFAAGGGDYFDIGNIHYVNQGDLATLNVRDFKELMDKHDIAKPIWVTEAEFSDENAVSSSLEGALEAGASKVFFTKLLFGKTGPPELNQYSEAFVGITERCNSQPTEQEPTGPPVIYDIGINLEPYDPGTGFAGDVYFEEPANDDKLFLWFGMDYGDGSPNPHPTFIVPLGTEIHAVSDGIVQWIETLGDNDYDVCVYRYEGDDWCISYEHASNVKVREGDAVKVGDVIGEAGRINEFTEFGKFDLKIWKGGVSILNYCPYELLDESVKSEKQEEISRLIQDWEDFMDKDIYNEDDWFSPGCEVETLQEFPE